jgi:hypothetical protein
LGKTALETAWSNYERLVTVIMSNKFSICDEITKKTIELFKKKYNNNVFRYSDIILPMALYMLDHEFYIMGKNYQNDWSYALNDIFEDTIGLSRTDNSLPLLETNISEKEFSKFDVQNTRIDYFENTIKSLNEELNQYNKQKNNFDTELQMLTSKFTKSDYDNSRIAEINDLLANNIDPKIAQITTNIADYNTKIDNLTKSKKPAIKKLLKQFLEDNKKKLENKGSVAAVDIYESVFKDVINQQFKELIKKHLYVYDVDVKTYPMICKKYLNNTVKNDYTQVLDKCTKYQKQIISDNAMSIIDKINAIQIIGKYYKNIVYPFSKTYFENPKEYNGSNFAMTMVMNIIIHVVKRFICVNIFGLIIKTIVKYVLQTFSFKDNSATTEKEYQFYIATLVTNVINDKKGPSNTSKLMNYIFEIFPLRATKIILQIYEGLNEGEEDIDRSLTLEASFDEISKIIGMTTTVDISSDSSLIMNLQQYIYPFCMDYLNSFVKDMKNILDNYLKSQQYQSNNLELLAILKEKLIT